MSEMHRHIQAYQEGDLDAFSQIYEGSIKKIYDFLYYKTLDQTVAEDLVSETFMKALKNMRNFSGTDEKELFAWLYRIAYNTFVDHYRSARETTDLDDVSDIIGQDAGFETLVDERSKIEEVLTYLETLPPRQKDIVVMRIWEDLSYAEISAITGQSVDNCKKIVSRVLKQVQANIAFMLCIMLIF